MHLLENNLILSQNVNEELSLICANLSYNKIFVLMDENTFKLCYPIVASNSFIENAEHIIIPTGEENKHINTVIYIWEELTRKGAKRNSIFINIGGGVVSDIGGFAASCFKRGMKIINIPTTLLSLVDASAGGKTGFNFMGYKNEIGLFSMPEKVIICPIFLKTLPKKEFISGFAEMLKHALICDENYLNDLMAYDLNNTEHSKITKLIAISIKIKQRIIEKDPEEKSIRKALNFGHTIGHAFESYALTNNIELLHGEAVALGIIGELYLSTRVYNFPYKKYKKIVSYIKNTYINIDTKGIESQLYQLMLHDKKNDSDRINFTLLKDIGEFETDNYCNKKQIIEALKQY